MKNLSELSKNSPIFSEAFISECKKYRYLLIRKWGNKHQGHIICPHVVWVMLNPSTADAKIDDPTIRKCIGFTKRWGYECMYVINLFGLRATNPKELKKASDPYGPSNEAWQRTTLIFSLAEKNLIVIAWGNHGTLDDAGDKFLYLLEVQEQKTAMCLGHTKNGQPKHPLMLSYQTPLIPFRGTRSSS